MVKFNRFGIVIAFIVFFLLLGCFNSYSTDDAFIGYRFATNFADGHGLVFNRGSVPVEGYTNFLWIMLLSAIAYFKLPLPETAALIGVCFSIGILILMLLWANRQKKLTSDFNIAAPVLLLAATPSLALWSHTGMETPMFTFLLLLGTLFMGLEERRGWLGILSGLTFALATLTRPEGLLIGGIIIGYSFVKSGEWKIKFPTFIIRTIVFLLPVLFHALWRKTYYGHWLPNTFYVKTCPGLELANSGFLYLKGFLLQGGLATIILILLALFIRPKVEGLSTILLLTIVYSAYVVWVGGDWMPANRFFLPLIPFLVMGASVFIAKTTNVSPRFSILLTILMCTHLLFHGIKANERFMERSFFAQKILGTDPPVDVLKELGLHLRENAAHDQVVAVIPAGKVPFYSDLQTIDMRGLCDSHISHQPFPDTLTHVLPGHFKRDDDYVLKQKPDYIVITGAVRKEDAEPLKAVKSLSSSAILDEWTILNHPDFIANYEEVRVPMPSGEKDLLYYKLKQVSDTLIEAN